SLRAASRGSSITTSGKKGATVSYGVLQATTTTFTVQKAIRGYLRQGTCVATRPAGSSSVKRCMFYKSVGTFQHVDVAGRNRFHFTGRIKGRMLKVGVYRLQAIPSFAGYSGAASRVAFTVIR
ncbi:MAG: hypothetical protein H7123_03605, partial [Thermoleophilia bacterium]|nr:hypothetical protein [Thermoleophilia bacterium]